MKPDLVIGGLSPTGEVTHTVSPGTFNQLYGVCMRYRDGFVEAAEFHDSVCKLLGIQFEQAKFKTHNIIIDKTL
jgi:hypothetical protein